MNPDRVLAPRSSQRFCTFVVRALSTIGMLAGNPAPAFAIQPSPDCAVLRATGPLTEAIVEDEGPVENFQTTEEPAVEVRLRFPVAYLEPPVPFIGADGWRTDGVSIEMHIADGTPVRESERRTDAGRLIDFDKREPAVVFIAHDRYEIDRAAAVLIRTRANQPVSWEPPALDLAPSSFSGLQEVISKRVWWAQRDRDFVAMSGGRITDLVTCNTPGSVPVPLCSHLFDYRNLNIDAQFALTALPDWQAAKRRVEQFMDCTYAGETAVGKGGKDRW